MPHTAMMPILRPQQTLVEQVYEAILSRISSGAYALDTRLIQEEVAESLGVSRQPVQQALLLLRNEGILTSAPGRGLMIAPLGADKARDLYEIREILDKLACMKAAERGSERARAEGQPYIDRGWQAVERNSIPALVKADIDFHHFIYELSGNPMIAETSSPHWAYLRCVMGAVLMSGGTPAHIWQQHEAIMQAIKDGNVELAGQLASTHISYASGAVQRKIADDQALESPKSQQASQASQAPPVSREGMKVKRA